MCGNVLRRRINNTPLEGELTTPLQKASYQHPFRRRVNNMPSRGELTTCLHEANRLEFGKYNTRLKTDIKPKEATFQVVLDAVALTPFYQAFLICPKIPRQEFKDLPLKHDFLSFIKDLGHSGDIIYLTDVQFRRTSLTGFLAQSIRSSNAIALDSPYLLVLITRTSQSRQHGKSESDSYYLSD
ncbi:hypothetical protein Tco_1482083 [Tanacetum coccineum]